jgi:hypothetical protein
MQHWDWFALILAGAAFCGYCVIANKLDRIIRLLEIGNENRR